MFKICVSKPFKNCERIYPIQQKKILELLSALDVDNVLSVTIFGSSVTDKCHGGSDLDIYIEMKNNSYPIKTYLDYKYDLWTNYSVDDGLLSEIKKKGVCVYERESVG